MRTLGEQTTMERLFKRLGGVLSDHKTEMLVSFGAGFALCAFLGIAF